MEDNQLMDAERVEPDPEGGWKGVDVEDHERVDNEEIIALASRIYAPLQPKDEKMFGGGRGA